MKDFIEKAGDWFKDLVDSPDELWESVKDFIVDNYIIILVVLAALIIFVILFGSKKNRIAYEDIDWSASGDKHEQRMIMADPQKIADAIADTTDDDAEILAMLDSIAEENSRAYEAADRIRTEKIDDADLLDEIERLMNETKADIQAEISRILDSMAERERLSQPKEPAINEDITIYKHNNQIQRSSTEDLEIISKPNIEEKSGIIVEKINMIKREPVKKFGADNFSTNRLGRVFTEEELLNQIRD